jgi:hypothetical protein
MCPAGYRVRCEMSLKQGVGFRYRFAEFSADGGVGVADDLILRMVRCFRWMRMWMVGRLGWICFILVMLFIRF